MENINYKGMEYIKKVLLNFCHPNKFIEKCFFNVFYCNFIRKKHFYIFSIQTAEKHFFKYKVLFCNNIQT